MIKEVMSIKPVPEVSENLWRITYIEGEPKGYGVADNGERIVFVKGSNEVEAVERFKKAYDEFLNGDFKLGMAR